MAITAFVLFCLFSLPSFIAKTWFTRCSVVLIGYHFVGEFRYGIVSLLEWTVFPMNGLRSNMGTAFIMIYARNKALFVFKKVDVKLFFYLFAGLLNYHSSRIFKPVQGSQKISLRKMSKTFVPNSFRWLNVLPYWIISISCILHR